MKKQFVEPGGEIIRWMNDVICTSVNTISGGGQNASNGPTHDQDPPIPLFP